MRPSPLNLSLALMMTSLISGFTLPTQANNLQDVYTFALENDHQLKADEAAYHATKEAIIVGRSGLLPQVTATASASRSSYDNLTSGIAGTAHVNTDNDSYDVTLTQPLFDMPAWFGYQQGAELSKLGEAQFSADQQSFILRVAERYFDVLRSIDNMNTAKAEEKALSHQLVQTKQRFEVGLTDITDVLESQAAFDNTTSNTLETVGNVDIAFDALEALTGHEHHQIAPLHNHYPVTNPIPTKRSDWVDFALQHNHSLKIAQLSAASAKHNARSKSSSHLPTVTSSYTYTQRNDTDTTSNGGTNSGSRLNDGETVAISLQVPIFSGLRTSGERREAHALRMQADELVNKTQRDIIQSVRSLYLSVIIDAAQVKASQQAVISSQSALDATQAGYNEGTRNLVDVLVSQQNLHQSQRNYDNARYDYIINTLNLKAAAGTLSPEDIMKLNEWLDTEGSYQRSNDQRL